MPILTEEEMVQLIERFLVSRGPAGATEEEIEDYIAYCQVLRVEQELRQLWESNVIECCGTSASGERLFRKK